MLKKAVKNNQLYLFLKTVDLLYCVACKDLNLCQILHRIHNVLRSNLIVNLYKAVALNNFSGDYALFSLKKKENKKSLSLHLQ